MNIDEVLDQTLENALRACSHECYACDGAGRVADHKNPIRQDSDTDEGRVHVMIWPWVPCEQCLGAGACVATFASPNVQTLVSGTVLGVIMRARADNNFGTLNGAIDWYERYLARLLHAPGMEEAVQAAADRLASAPPIAELLRGKLERLGALAQEVGDQHENERLAGALTPEELRDLGIDEEEEP